MSAVNPDRPVLWHLAMSHYNEKVRWALDLKQLPHSRRALMPGVHQLFARRRTGGSTTPILEIGDEWIGESAAIVARLDEIEPDPPLYPEDPILRARAIELERQFDQLLAPASRRFLYQEMLEDREFGSAFLAVGGPRVRRRIFHAAFPRLVPVLRKGFGVPPRDDPGPRSVMREQLALIGELAAESGYLVGDSLTVADLAACSFLIPFVDPHAMPLELPQLPPAVASFGRELAETDGGRWVSATYRQYRSAS